MLHFFVQHSFQVALFPWCTFFILYGFHFAPFCVLHSLHIASFYVLHFPCGALFSSCPLFCVASCCTDSMLDFFRVALFMCCALLMSHLCSSCTIFILQLFLCYTVALFYVSFFSYCFTLRSVHVAPFPSCILMFHFFQVVLFSCFIYSTMQGFYPELFLVHLLSCCTPFMLHLFSFAYLLL